MRANAAFAITHSNAVLQRNHGKKNGHFNKYVIEAPMHAEVQSTWEMNGVKSANGKFPGHKTVTAETETNWWDVKTKQTDSRGLPVNLSPKPATANATLTLDACGPQFHKTHSDDIKRQGRSDTLHAGAYMGYYPDNANASGWYDDQGRVACPFPATPKDNHDGAPKPRGVRRKVR